jgi:PAS domain S-box-containing protein
MFQAAQHHLLGELIIDMGFITRDQLEEALDRQAEQLPPPLFSYTSPADMVVAQARTRAMRKPRLGEVLVNLNFMTLKQVQEALQRQHEYFKAYHELPAETLHTLLEVGVAVNSGMNAAEVLELILDVANRLLDCESSTIMLLDQDSGELVFSIPTGPKADMLADIRIPPGKGIAGWVASRNEPVLTADASADERFFGEIDRKSGYHSRTMICVPMVYRGSVVGVVEAINKEREREFDSRDLLILTRLADQAAATVENARLYNELYSRMDQLLLREKEKYKNLLDTLTVAVVSVDSEGAVVYVNPHVEALTGKKEREFIGRSFDGEFAFRDHAGRQVSTEELLRDCRDAPGEYFLIDAGGNRRRISVSIAPLDTGPNRRGFQSILRDIGREKEIQESLLQSQRLVATGKLAGAVAHEINSPLQGIVSVLDLIRTRYPEEDWLLDRLWDLDKAFVHIRDTVKKLLELNRPGAEQTQLLSLNIPVEEAVGLLQGYSRKQGVELSLDLDPALPEARIAPAMIGQVLMSLVSNAAEAMAESEDGDSRRIWISTSSTDDWILLVVDDSGRGVPREQRESIFDASFSTKHGAGVGVGLAVCRAVVQQHDGEIDVEDSPRGGARFILRFPRANGSVS